MTLDDVFHLMSIRPTLHSGRWSRKARTSGKSIEWEAADMAQVSQEEMIPIISSTFN